jgi:hypothetical protein
MRRTTRRAARIGVFAVLASTAAALPAAAQVHLQFLGGVTRAGETQPFVGGGLGLRIGFVEIDGEVGRFKDILPKGVLDAANDLQEQFGLPVQGIASVPATYAVGSLRFIPAAGPFRPFLSVGYGVARLDPRIDVVVEGISFGDVFGLTSLGKRTEPMVMLGAGLRVGNKAHLELGYRYVVVFSEFEPDTNFDNDQVLTYVNALYAGVGVGF